MTEHEIAERNRDVDKPNRWQLVDRVCVCKLNGRTYVSVETDNLRPVEPRLGTFTYYPMNEAMLSMSLDELRQLYERDRQQEQQQEKQKQAEAKERKLEHEMEVRLRRIILESDSENERDMARKMLKQLKAKANSP